MLDKEKFLRLIQAMQKTNASCARTFARFAGFADVSKIQHDLQNVPDDKKSDAARAVQYDTEAEVMRRVATLMTNENFFETMYKNHFTSKEDKKP